MSKLQWLEVRHLTLSRMFAAIARASQSSNALDDEFNDEFVRQTVIATVRVWR